VVNYRIIFIFVNQFAFNKKALYIEQLSIKVLIFLIQLMKTFLKVLLKVLIDKFNFIFHSGDYSNFRISYVILGWSVQYERGNGLVQIRSLKWLGMAFFHIPETNRFGSLYFGIGEENKDLPFMI